MTTIRERSEALFQQELLNALADTGECLDFWDIEVKLRTRGYSADEARMALADVETRRALNERCHQARMGQRRRA